MHGQTIEVMKTFAQKGDYYLFVTKQNISSQKSNETLSI